MRRNTILLSLLGLMILIAGCTQSTVGIFESIELEREIVDDRDLENELLVGSMARAADRYFIAAATLLYRSVTDANYVEGDRSQWVKVTSPGTSNSTTTSLALFSGSGGELLYAVYSSQDASEAGIYSIDPASPPAGITDDAIFGTDDASVEGLGRIFAVNDGISDYLLVTVQKPGTSLYSVYGSTTGAAGSFNEISTDLVGNLPVTDIAASASGTVVFMTSKSVYVDSDGLSVGNPPAKVSGNMDFTDGDTTRQPEFGGVFYQESESTLWVTDNDGYLYRSTDFGGNWTQNASAHLTGADEDDPALEFTDMAAVANGGTELLVVGTSSEGYRELATDFTPTMPEAEASNYEASEFASATVLTFMVDSETSAYVPVDSGYELKNGDLLFAGTSSHGLWKALYTGDAAQWIRE